VDYSSGVKVTVSHDGIEVTYVAARPMRLAGALRARSLLFPRSLGLVARWIGNEIQLRHGGGHGNHSIDARGEGQSASIPDVRGLDRSHVCRSHSAPC
jgi:hypothetical protein